MNVMHSSLMKPRAFYNTMSAETDRCRYDNTDQIHATIDRTFAVVTDWRAGETVESFVYTADLMSPTEPYKHCSLYYYCPFEYEDESTESMRRPTSSYTVLFFGINKYIKDDEHLQHLINTIYDNRRRIE